MTYKLTSETGDSEVITLQLPERSPWVCYLWGSSKESPGMTWQPDEHFKIPNRLQRWLMKVCFGCTWVYTRED